MRIKYGFWTTLVGLLLITAVSVYAQANTACPTLVQESYTATEFLCEAIPDGQACIGNGVVNASPIDGALIQFANPGELAPLAQLQRLQVQTLNTDNQAWTSVAGKLDASTRDGEPAIVDMLIFGDTVVSNAIGAEAGTAVADVLSATIQAAGGIIVRQDARVDSNNIWQLTNAESVQAIGRSADNQWVRVIIPSPNGGAGWVFGQFIDVNGGRELLPFHTNASPIPAGASSASEELSLKPMQAFRLESLLTDPSCAETHDSGVMLQSPTLETRVVVEINGVELRIRGTVFVTAQIGDKMTIYNLEGETAVVANEERVDMTVATVTEIPLDASLEATGAPSEVAPYSQELADIFIFLPVRLLSRNFEVTFIDASLTTDNTTTDNASNQSAPPPPAATETPPEVVEQPDNCPTLIQESYTAAEFLCESLSPNSACVGNSGAGRILTFPREGVENLSFAGPGDIVDIRDIQLLQVGVFDDPDNIWTSIVMTLDAKTTTGATAQANMLLFGEVELENKGEASTVSADSTDTTAVDTTTTAPPPATTLDTTTTATGIPATIQAPSGIIVRAQPRVDTDTVGQLQDGDAVTALGRSLDQQWIQVQSPSGITGWVFLQFVAVEGGTDALPVIDPSAAATNNTAPPPATNNTVPPPPAAGITTTTGDQPEFTLMQAFNVSTIDVEDACQDSTDSGMVIQSPDDIDGNMILRINGVDVELSGTIFIRSEKNVNMDVTALEGEVTLTALDGSQTIEAGQRASLQLTDGSVPNSPPNPPSEYSFKFGSRLAFLPTRLLPRAFDLIVPPEPAGNSTVDNSGSSNTTSTNTSSGDVVSVGGTIVDFGADCEISAGGEVRNLRADAGSGFDVINTLQPGQSIVAATQKRGADGLYWYETSQGWIRQDAGVTTPDCANLPLFGVIYDTTGTTSGGNTGSVAAVAPVAPPAPPQPTAVPPPPLVSDAFGNVCDMSSNSYSVEIEQGGVTFIEFGGTWTGQAGTSATFVADIPYYRAELGNVLTFVNEDGSQWLGSIDSTAFTINFDSTRRFRVRVAGLLGDFISLRVSC